MATTDSVTREAQQMIVFSPAGTRQETSGLVSSNGRRIGLRISPIVWVIAGILVTGPGAIAQSTFGTLVGTVLDPSGAIVSNCIVTVENKGTSARRSAITGQNGTYSMTNLEPSLYSVQVAARGFIVAR